MSDNSITLRVHDLERLQSHIAKIHGDRMDIETWINDAIAERMQIEQAAYDKLSDAGRWYRSPEGRAAIERLRRKD